MGDWEDGYEQLPVLFIAIKAVNPSMHYKYIPKSIYGRMGGRYSSVLSGASLNVLRPLGTVVSSSPLMVHS